MNNNLMLAATATVSSAALIALSLRVFSKKDPKVLGEVEEDEDLDPDECIQPEDVSAVFDDLFLHMQAVLAQLSQQIQQIQMSGQFIPEKQLRQLLKSEFERNLMAKQKEIFDKHDVDEDCLRGATWEFMEQKNEKVKNAVERFQKLFEQISGEKVVGKLPGKTADTAESEAVVETLSKEKLLEAAQVYFDSLTSSMKTIVDKFKSEGKNLKDMSVAQQLQLQFANVANDAGESALKEIGVTLDSFQASIQKYQTDPMVGKTLTVLQLNQQRELHEMGVMM